MIYSWCCFSYGIQLVLFGYGIQLVLYEYGIQLVLLWIWYTAGAVFGYDIELVLLYIYGIRLVRLKI